jgi:hypothetical protein
MQEEIINEIRKVKTGEITPEECADKLFLLYSVMFKFCVIHDLQPVMGMDNVILEYRCSVCGEQT